MKLSTDRILTTHVGSLPRPPDLLAMLEAREAAQGFGEAAFAGLYKLSNRPESRGVIARLALRVVEWIIGLVGYLVYLRMKAHHDSSPMTCLLSRTAVRSENDSKTMASARIATAQPPDSSWCGCRSFSSPSNSANNEPMVKITSATTKAQK